MSVKRIVVVTLVVVDVFVSPGGGGGGGTYPGEWICPANAETASTKLRVVAAHVWRNVFIGSLLVSMQKFCMRCKFCIKLVEYNFSCKSVKDCVRFAAQFRFPCAHMTLRASLLRELVNPNLSVGGRAELCCELARDFENKGEYEEAREVLSGLWPRIGERPNLRGLEASTAAEVLLRAGVLTGFIGSSHQIADAQEKAKNLISESLSIFEARKFIKKIAEAQIELALCYWRTGEYDEALIY